MTQRMHLSESLQEFRPMLHLALPVVAAELGWMAMSVVDTIMVGRLGAESLGAVSIGTALFYSIGVVGAGALLGLDAVVPQAYGAKRLADCHRALFQAVYGLVPLGIVLAVPMFGIVALLPRMGFDPQLATLAAVYTRALLWSTGPLLLFMAFRHYLQGMNHVRPVMVVLVSANLVNVVANWVFIFGHLGSPAFGVSGAGWASCASSVYMCLALLGYLLWQARRDRTGLFEADRSLNLAVLRRLTILGLPAAAQRGIEIGVFAAATFLTARLGSVPLAAHQVAMQAASVTFMVPLGISTAAAVRVGQAIGRGDPLSAHRSGSMALALGGVFMGAAGMCFLLIPGLIVRIFSDDPTVIETGIALLAVAALFQLFDGFQVVATGALRGVGDTRTPMLANLVGHWFVGLPIGCLLAFWLGWGVVGIWTGLCLGLMLVGLFLARVWRVRVHELPGT
jgi:MATE family multidrug resistance protein